MIAMSPDTPLTPAAPAAVAADKKPRISPALFWGGMIIGLLAVQFGLSGWGIYCALKGRQNVVEADYYNKALHWDEHLAMQQASNALGWKTQLQVGDAVTTDGQRALIFNINDSAAAPVKEAHVDVTFFHHARPLELRSATLTMVEPGKYAASVPLETRGIWEFRLTVKHGADTFIESIQTEVAP